MEAFMAIGDFTGAVSSNLFSNTKSFGKVSVKDTSNPNERALPNRNSDAGKTSNKSSMLNSSVAISNDAMRLYEQSQKNITGNSDGATDTAITSPDVNQLDLAKQPNFQNPQGQANLLISAATFSDLAMRQQLQAYYESKKTVLDEFIKEQENGPLSEIKVISFDEWLEFSAQSFSDSDDGALSIKAAQQNIENIQQNSPDGSSHVKMTFSDHGTLLAYIDSDGGLVTHESGGLDSRELTQQADVLGLSDENRIDYLGREIEALLSSRYPDVKVTTYADNNIPSKREFSRIWYPNHDVDADYKNAMIDAIDMLEKAQKSNLQSEKNMFEIQEFMLKIQQGVA